MCESWLNASAVQIITTEVRGEISIRQKNTDSSVDTDNSLNILKDALSYAYMNMLFEKNI